MALNMLSYSNIKELSHEIRMGGAISVKLDMYINLKAEKEVLLRTSLEAMEDFPCLFNCLCILDTCSFTEKGLAQCLHTRLTLLYEHNTLFFTWSLRYLKLLSSET
jgi:hypothetical protein